MLNTIVAQSVRFFADEIEKLKSGGMAVDAALKKVTIDTLKKHKRIIFGGNGYSAEWEAEAARRGLPNLRTTPEALDTYYSEKNIDLFESMNVLTRQELQARSSILFEDYTKRILIEGRVLSNMALTQIAPVAFEYQKVLAESISALEAVTGKNSAKTQRESLAQLTQTLNSLIEHAKAIQSVVNQAHHQESISASAHYCQKELKPLMVLAREASDELEAIIPAKDWPLPTYHQMLFMQD